MTVRVPKPRSAARILREALGKEGIVLGQSKALEVVAKLYGHNSWYAMCQAEKSQSENELGTMSSEHTALDLTKVRKTGDYFLKYANVLMRISPDEQGLGVSLKALGSAQSSSIDSAYASFSEANTDRTKPDKTLAFFGCRLPKAITGIAQVSDEGELVFIAAEQSFDDYLKWLEEGMPNNDCDVSETAIILDRPPYALSGEELLQASLDSTGLFTLANLHFSFCLIDENGERWKPTERV